MKIDLNNLNDLEPVFACGIIPYPEQHSEVDTETERYMKFFHRRQHAEESLEVYHTELNKLYTKVPDILKSEENLIKVFIVGIYSRPIVVSFQIMDQERFPVTYHHALRLALDYEYHIRNLRAALGNNIPTLNIENTEIQTESDDTSREEDSSENDDNVDSSTEERNSIQNSESEDNEDSEEEEEDDQPSSPLANDEYFIESIDELQNVSENVIIDGTVHQSYALSSVMQRNYIELPQTREEQLDVDEELSSDDGADGALPNIRSIRRRLF